MDLASGSTDAYDRLFLRYYPRVLHYIEHLVKSPEIAKDLAQDIFMKIWINREQMAMVDSFDSYVFRAAKNSALNYLEHMDVRLKYEAATRDRKNVVSMDEEIDAGDMELLVRVVVDGMPEQRKKIFILSRRQHLKTNEIALMLNLSEKTVKNHLTLALREIKKALLAALLIFFNLN